MSIIHEALKKVQKNLKGNGSPDLIAQKASTPQSEPAIQKPKQSESASITPTRPSQTLTPQAGLQKSWVPVGAFPPSNAKGSLAPAATQSKTFSIKTMSLFFIAFFSLLFICLFFLFSQKQQPSQTAKPKAPIAAAIPISESTTVPIPVPALVFVDSNPKIVVHGIMSRGNQNLALIDNNIYEAGDMIGEIKIVEISPDYVKIVEEDGKLKTLKVQARH